MKIALLDSIGGIAGDMTMAAFVSAGFPIDELSGEIRKLDIGHVELVARHVVRSAITAVHIDVVVPQPEGHHRTLKEIESIIEGSTLGSMVKQRAKAIFTLIAQAEAKVHNTTLERVHLHEVGALDSIVDIVGVAVCLDYFGVDQVYATPVRLGSGGTITTQHGTMPVPAPATLEILTGYPTVMTRHPYELTTPTGAAIVKALSAGPLDEEVLVPEAVGYGAGTKEFPELPNLLRVVIGSLRTSHEVEEILVVETNIDDMNPQVYPYLIESLLASGAHDAYLVPIIMKKGRPGILLSVMVARPQLDTVVDVIYRETTTIGLRIMTIGRRKLPREHTERQTSFGQVKVRAVVRNGREVAAPEYEECKRIAKEKHLPLLDVMRALERELGGSPPPEDER
jgi:uncharacterized protein (TIGR00299 family) protein